MVIVNSRINDMLILRIKKTSYFWNLCKSKTEIGKLKGIVHFEKKNIYSINLLFLHTIKGTLKGYVLFTQDT